MQRLADIALREFADIWFSKRRPGVYAYHWERRLWMARSPGTTTFLTNVGNTSLPFPSISTTARNYSGGDWKSPFWACGHWSAFADLLLAAPPGSVGAGRHLARSA